MPDIGTSSSGNEIAKELGRPDLADGLILRALRDRLSEHGTPRSLTEIRGALAENDAALQAMLRTLDLPPPVAPLPMPTQSLRRRPVENRASRLSSFFGLAPTRG